MKVKTERLEILKDIVKRRGVVDQPTIINAYCLCTGEENSSSLKRKLYRDLETLVEANLLEELFYTRDNIEIKDFAPDNYKNYQKKWRYASNTSIIGQSLITNQNASIWAPSFLQNHISIVEGNADPIHNVHHLYFTISDKFLCLRIELDLLPISIHISRYVGELKNDEINECLNLSKRSILLRVPVANVSSYKTHDNNGHCLISILPNHTLKIEDLNSSNGTHIIPLTPIESDNLRRVGNLSCERTVSKSWNSVNNSPQERILVTTEESSIPTMVECSDRFRILIT